jgi:hypothetical protein
MFHVAGAQTNNNYVRVAELVIGLESLEVSCFVKTGNLFINGRTALSHKCVRETLEWYMGESMDNYTIKDLYFQNGTAIPRHAHDWELRTFYTSHWRYYAKNNIRISAMLETNLFIDCD